VVVGDYYETRGRGQSGSLVVCGTMMKAQGRALEMSWELPTKLDRLLADFCYVDDWIILGAVVGDAPGVGSKVEDNVGCCVGDGVGPIVDVWDCYDGSGPSQSVD